MDDLPQTLSLSFWGEGPEIDREAARVIARHAAAIHREQRRRAEAQAMGDLVRDAIVEGVTTRAAVIGLLMAAPPPALSILERMRAVLSRAVLRLRHLHQWSVHHVNRS